MSEEQHLKVLGLHKDPKESKKKFPAIKKAFTAKIRASKTQEQRATYNLAYESLTNQIFDILQTPNQKLVIQAIYKGDVAFLKAQFMKDAKFVNFKKQKTNYPLLYLATRSGNYEVVQLILKYGCSLDFSKDRSTPMHCASYYGYQHLIPLLSKYGIPTHTKNFDNHVPKEQAYNKTIESLLQISSQNIFQKLVQKLIDKRKALATLNLSFAESKKLNLSKSAKFLSFFSSKKEQTQLQKQAIESLDVRKILLNRYFEKQYESWIDAFHGTNFGVLDSIAINGLHGVGQKINGQKLTVVQGHILERVSIASEKNWAKAIFVSPSIYYAGNPVYSKKIQINGTSYCPIVQVKVKPQSFLKHKHTLKHYEHKKNEPVMVEYRIPCEDEDEEEEKSQLIFTSPQNHNVKVVAILLVKAGFLAENNEYEKVSELVLNSEQEKNFKKHGKVNKSMFYESNDGI